MCNYRMLFVGALASTCIAPAVRAQSSHAGVAAMTRLADSLDRAGFSGTIVLADRQHMLLVRAMGFADARSRRRLTATDTWRWASVSKQVTAALVLREVDGGRLALDTPAVRYLPAFTGGGRERITVRQLLQHTSGLPNHESGASDADGMPRVYREVANAKLGAVGDPSYGRTCAGPVVAQPGERFDYNNCDYLVLGRLLQARTGRSTSELVRTVLGTSVQQRETVRGYISADSLEPPFNLATYGSAGSMTGTVHALVAFDRLLLGTLLSSSARAEMWRGEPKFGFAALGAWSFTAPLQGCANPAAIVERRGAIQGVQVRNVLLPELGLIALVFTNRSTVDFGEVWQGKGLLHDVLSAAACAGD